MPDEEEEEEHVTSFIISDGDGGLLEEIEGELGMMGLLTARPGIYRGAARLLTNAMCVCVPAPRLSDSLHSLSH